MVRAARRLLPSIRTGPSSFKSASPGVYWLRVSAGAGSVIHEELVNVGGPGELLNIRLKNQSSANRTAEPSISLRQLTHKVPRPAQKAFDRGRQADCQGRPERCRGMLPAGNRRGS